MEKMERGYIQLRWDSRKMEKVFTIILCAIAIIQVCCIVVCNFIKADKVINTDSAVAIRHGVEMWLRHSLFLDNFKYGTSLEIDTPAFLFLPLFIWTGKLGLAFAVGYACLYAAEAYVCCDIFHNMGKGRTPGILATILLFTPYSIGELDWAKMHFYVEGQYSFRILSLLMLINMLFLFNREKELRKKIIFASCTAIVVFWTTLSSGSYILLVEIIPLTIWLIFKWVNKNTIKLRIDQLIAWAAVVLAAVLGKSIQNAFAGAMLTSNNNVLTASEFWPNLGNGFTGFFMLFGGMTDQRFYEIMTKDGIEMLMRCIFPVIAIGAVLLHMLVRKKVTELEGMALLVSAVNLVVIVFTRTRYGAPIFEHRYHIIWAVSLLICVAELWSDWKEIRHRMLFLIAVVVFVVTLNEGGFRNIRHDNIATDLAKDIVKIANELNCDTIYCYDELTMMIQTRCLAYDKYCEYITMKDGDMQSRSIHHWYIEYSDRTNVNDRNMLVINSSNAEDVLKMLPNDYRYVKNINDDLQVYIGETNPWDGISGLPLADTSLDYPYSHGYTFDGELVDGAALMKAEEDAVLIGPNTEALEGIYTIDLSYEGIDTEEPCAYLCVRVDGEEVFMDDMIGEDGTITFENVKIPAGAKFSIELYSISGDWLLTEIKYEAQR